MTRLFDKWLAFICKPFVRIMLILVSVLSLIFGFLIYYNKPLREVNPCSFYDLTNLYCPACGMTRAVDSVLELNFIKAFSHNLLWPIFMFFVLLAVFIWFYFLTQGKNIFNKLNYYLQKIHFSGIVVVIILLLFWLLRNINIYPFNLLAP